MNLITKSALCSNLYAKWRPIDCAHNIFFVRYRYGSLNPLFRRPIRILTNQESDNLKTDVNEIKSPVLPPVRVQDNSVKVPAPSIKKVVQPYVKLSEVDDRFIKVLTNLKSRNRREKTGQMLLEGKRLINDAITAGIEPIKIFFSREETLAEIDLTNAPKVELYKVLYRTLRAWSDVNTCPGIMGVFRKPTYEEIVVMNDPVIPVTVLCDNIRDPGNMGAIIRSAAAAGCRCILLTKGCVDPWEQKVLRTGMGAHFRIPVINNIPWEHVVNYLPRTSTVYLADNSTDVDLLDTDIISEADIEESENTEERYVCQTEEGENVLVDHRYSDDTHLEEYKEVFLPCYLYSSIKFPKDDIVIYIGGETHGVSPQANKLACEFGGHRVKLPLENGIESLNSAFALAIILYEIKRQKKEFYVTKL